MDHLVKMEGVEKRFRSKTSQDITILREIDLLMEPGETLCVVGESGCGKTTLGRILDPFADKVIICAAFIYLLLPMLQLHVHGGLRPWMVVVIVGRELLVTALRSFFEERGSDFSAKMSGKLKMVLQCVAAGATLLYLHLAVTSPVPDWLRWTMIVSTWAAVILTAYSGLIYIWVAVKLLHGDE